jgi:diacylglycerol kinase family enzyme
VVDDRWFVFAAGIGFDAAIVAGVEKQRGKGKRSTHALYVRVGLREFLRADRRHPQLHVELPDGSTLDNVYFALVTNADPWTYVGNRPLHPTPDVTFDNGLALYARRRMSAAGMLFSMVRLSGSSPRIGRRGAHLHHDLGAVTIRADQPLPVQVDGDLLTPQDKLSFRAVSRAIQVIV